MRTNILLIIFGLMVAGCSLFKEKKNTEPRVTKKKPYEPRYLRYERCVERMVTLDIYEATNIQLLCNEAHGVRNVK
jgi:hypothetical protein